MIQLRGSRSRSNQPNRFVYYARKIYHPLGFKKGYNFTFFFITCGALMGFALARLQYLDIEGKFLPNAIAGEQYWYRSGFRRVGITLHLATVLPAAFLVTFQFIPVIRHKFIIFHRINGYVCIVLLLLGNVGAFMIMKHAVGGQPMLQCYLGILGAMVTGGLIISYINLEALQIDQHRAWMIRAWSWAASIITLRLIMGFGILVTAQWYEYWNLISCAEIWYMYTYYSGVSDSQNPTPNLYPQCQNATSTVMVPVSNIGEGPENAASIVQSNFGLGGLVALAIHIILVELYLGLTPAESARLRMISYERQVKAGLRYAEKGGLTATRLGDAPPGWNSPIVPTHAVPNSDTHSIEYTVDGSKLQTDDGHHRIV